MKVSRDRLIICNEDHGGYKAGYCVVCGACGWLDNLNHVIGCPLANPKVKEVDVLAKWCRLPTAK